MLHEFLVANRNELIARCEAKVALRAASRIPPRDMEHGIPMFLEQLIHTLRIDELARAKSGGNSPEPEGLTEKQKPTALTATATNHGRDLLEHGYTIDQVVHDYGDLCQAIAGLAIEMGSPISTDEFQIMNLCLDNAIAAAVTEFDRERDLLVSASGNRAMSERLGFLAHELRNSLSTAMLAVAVIKQGKVGLVGATGDVLDRSLVALRDLIERALTEARLGTDSPAHLDEVSLCRFIAQVQVAASLEARVKGCEFSVSPVDPLINIRADPHLLGSAVANILQNAFKFTRPHSLVSLKAYAHGDRALIEVADQCGGLPAGHANTMFHMFEQLHEDRSGLGLGLSIARRAVELNGGTLSVRDLPGHGCVFTVDLPRCAVTEIPSEVISAKAAD